MISSKITPAVIAMLQQIKGFEIATNSFCLSTYSDVPYILRTVYTETLKACVPAIQGTVNWRL